VVQHQGLAAASGEPFVAGDKRRRVEHVNRLCAQTHPDTPCGVAGRDRVEVLADTDPRLAVDPRRQQQRHVERLIRQRRQGQRLSGEVLADGHVAHIDPSPVIDHVAGGHELVQLDQRCDDRDRHQVTAPEPADLTLNAALLVSADNTGPTEERVEPIVRPHRHRIRHTQHRPLTTHHMPMHELIVRHPLR
jgi:hypothetical protein